MNLFKQSVVKDEEWKEGNKRREDNLSGEPAESEDSLWYPDRENSLELDKIRLKTRGKYKNKFPEGAVIHYTAGRSRSEDSRKKDIDQLALDHLKWQEGEQSYCYFLIDANGKVYQQFPLDEWGYHAGKSSWQTVKGSVSNEFVGIEVMNAGRVNKIDEDTYRAWFTVTERGDRYYSKKDVRFSDSNENIKRGYYLKYTEKQEESLLNLLYWLFDKGDGIFKIKNIVGHDEVAPTRKDDPGASLSMTMKELRRKIIDKKIEDKDITEKDLLDAL